MTKITKNIEGMYVIEQGNCEGMLVSTAQFSYYAKEMYAEGIRLITNEHLTGGKIDHFDESYDFVTCLQFTEEDMKHISHNAIDLINILSQSSDLNPLGLVTSFGVGGCVRDTILNKPAKDIDIVTVWTPKQVYNILKNAGITVTDNAFDDFVAEYNSVHLVYNDEHFEITSFRKDKGDYREGCDICYDGTSIITEEMIMKFMAEDAIRRDFTINALYLNIRTYEVFGYNISFSDIEKRIVRFIGHPLHRICEDRIRILRFFRFSMKDRFIPSIESAQCVKEACEIGLLELCSWERKRDEICKMMLIHPTNMINMLIQYHILSYLFPELEKGIDFDQHNKHHTKPVIDHELDVTMKAFMICMTDKKYDTDEKKLILLFAALLHDSGKPLTFSQDESGEGHFYDHQKESVRIAENILRQFRFDNLFIDQVCFLIERHMTEFVLDVDKPIKRVGGLQDMVQRFGEEYAYIFADLLSCDKSKLSEENIVDSDLRKIVHKGIERLLERYRVKKNQELSVSMKDILQRYNLKGGIAFGKFKQHLIDCVDKDVFEDSPEDIYHYCNEFFKDLSWKEQEEKMSNL